MAGVRLNKQFYSSLALEKTIEAYKHLAHFSVRQSPRYYHIRLSRIASGFKHILKDEFSNYALVLSKNANP